MLKTTLFSAVMVMAATSLAHAGGSPGSLGVGAEFQINGVGGASLNYDAGDFHLGGFFGFADDDGADNTVFDVGARFYYHVHSTAMSDFGVGGSLGILSFPEAGVPDPDRNTGLFLEPGVQMRLFLASNVAISASTGISIGLVDVDGVVITGQVITGGIHYYFF
jgi:hypothetical protein